jgi:hypothetical protein
MFLSILVQDYISSWLVLDCAWYPLSLYYGVPYVQIMGPPPVWVVSVWVDTG